MAGGLRSFIKKFKKALIIVIGSISAMGVLILSLVAIFHLIRESGLGDIESRVFIFFIFFLLSISRFPLILQDKNKINIIKNIVFAIIHLGIAIAALCSVTKGLTIGILASIYTLTIVANRICRIFEKKTKLNIISNILYSIFSMILFLVVLSFALTDDVFFSRIILFGLTAAIALSNILYFAFAQMKLKSIYKVVKKTYALEIFYGFFVVIIAFSFVFYITEPAMEDYGDALWYSFCLVTTIGLGDLSVTSAVNRVLSVILGIYGIIIVALITSIIVNLYNESSVNKSEEKKENEEEDIEENKEE